MMAGLRARRLPSHSCWCETCRAVISRSPCTFVSPTTIRRPKKKKNRENIDRCRVICLLRPDLAPVSTHNNNNYLENSFTSTGPALDRLYFHWRLLFTPPKSFFALIWKTLEKIKTKRKLLRHPGDVIRAYVVEQKQNKRKMLCVCVQGLGRQDAR